MKKQPNNPLISDDSVHAIIGIASAYKQSKIFLTACELDIFTIIESEERTSKEISIEAGTDESATLKLLDALCAMNFLTKNDGKYRNTKATRRFLVRSRPEYLGNLMYHTYMWEKWDDLTTVIRHGENKTYQELEEKSQKWVDAFVDSLHWRNVLKAPDIVSLIDLHEINKLLDLGCSSGIYSMEFKKAKPSLDITAFDSPKITNETFQHFKRAKMENDIKLIGGDIFTDDIGKGYDAVFISDTLAKFDFKSDYKILHKIFDALNYGGKIIVHDIIIEDNKIEPLSATIDSLELLINTKGGDVFTETDIWVMLNEAWFSNVKRIKTPFDTSLIIGTK